MKRILNLSLGLILAGAGFCSTVILAQTASSSTSDGVYNPDQSKRGDPLYQKTCASCHGNDLLGNGQSPALSGDDFVSNWQGQSLDDLFEKIQTTMPADNPGSLTRAQTADILAYILSANKFPAGKTDLPVEGDVLKHIRIDKPPAVVEPPAN